MCERLSSSVPCFSTSHNTGITESNSPHPSRLLTAGARQYLDLASPGLHKQAPVASLSVHSSSPRPRHLSARRQASLLGPVATGSQHLAAGSQRSCESHHRSLALTHDRPAPGGRHGSCLSRPAIRDPASHWSVT